MKKLNSITAILALFLVMYSTSCKKWGEKPGGGTGNNPAGCQLKGVLFAPACGFSALDNLWIRTADGKTYQPCANDIINIQKETYAAGDEVTFSTRALRAGESCKDELILCPPNMPMADYRVGLTCLVKVAPRELTAEGYFRDYRKLDGCTWVFETLKGEKLEIAGWLPAMSVLENKRAVITYKESLSQISICMVGKRIDVYTVKYTDLTNGITCKSILQGKSPDTKQTVGIYNAKIDGDKLRLSLTFSGCDFKTDDITLHMEGINHASDPEAIYLKLGNLPEEQACQAFFMKEVCFDLGSIAKKGDVYILQIEGYATPLRLEM